MFFCLLDTIDGNQFAPFSGAFEPLFSRYFEALLPEFFNIFLREAMNKRLGFMDPNTQLQTFKDILLYSVLKKNMTIQEVVAMPENDDWTYSDGKQLVCSTIIVAMYKEGGMFGNIRINATEFTPKDLYQLNIYNTTFDRPEECKEADPHVPYCQIMGDYRMDLPGLSTINPYDHMNEKCPSVPYLYDRPSDC